MGGYVPMKITGMATGLVQSREEMILPDDAYPILQNAFVWRERIKRKQGTQLLARLRRKFTDVSLGTSGASPWSFNIYSQLAVPIVPETNAQIEPGSVVITIQAGPNIVFTDQGDGTLTSPTLGNSGTINYTNGNVILTTTAAAGTPTIISFNYFPALPVMGLLTRELNATNNEATVAFDTKYAYRFTGGGWQEFIPGTTWTGGDSDFFWSTNFFVNNANLKLFWVTNFSGTSGDPIRYTDGTSWTNFAPQIDAAGNLLTQCQALLPFRGRLVAFNTFEGPNLANSASFPQRIRWAAIGDPNAANAWRDDIRGKGGFLDIPTSQSIISVGFVRDNLVIYCERSTWQLRYTGRAIAPFQVEKVNSELGAESTFSAVQFDTSLVGIGDKGVVECDSFKSDRIDIKIPDLVFSFNNDNQGTKRVYGIRDFVQKIAYWSYPYVPSTGESVTYPNRRLIYNYENDSWAIYEDCFTCFGNFQPPTGRTWQNVKLPWIKCNFPWTNRPLLIPEIIGGNQQGYTMYVDQQTTNDPSLYIKGITGNTTTPTSINSPSHNLATGQIISITNIPLTSPFATRLNNPTTGKITAITQANPCQITSNGHNLTTGAQVEILNVGGMVQLNGNIYTVTVIDANNFTLNVDSTTFTPYTTGGTWENQAVNAFYVYVTDPDNFLLYKYDLATDAWTLPQLDPPGAYVGGGQIEVRDNFAIVSKKFNFLDEGESIQMGFIDVLMPSTLSGAISLQVFLNYNNTEAVNVLPQNLNKPSTNPDTFFNSIVPTNSSDNISSTKYWQRVYCPVRGNFLTVAWTLSNSQMNGIEQEENVQIDAQVLWVRKAGRMTNI